MSRAPPLFELSPAQRISLQTSDVPVERVRAAALDVPVFEQFANAQFPVGEQQLYSQEWNLARVSSAEKRHLDRLMHDDVINVARHAAEVHRQVRVRMQQVMKPGMLLTEICDETETLIRQLVRADGLQAGVAFPTGASLNHCAAHFAPNTGDKTVLKQDDLIKLDFGVHIGGRIIDCGSRSRSATTSASTSCSRRCRRPPTPALRPPASTCACPTSAPPSRKS